MDVENDQLQVHLWQVHPIFLSIIRSLYMPPDLETFHLNVGIDVGVDDEDNSYESLSELCDLIGNVEVGVKDIDVVTTVLVNENEQACPICLERVPTTSCYARRVIDCGHLFCGQCLETWLGSHKTCPVCKLELDTKPTPKASD